MKIKFYKTADEYFAHSLDVVAAHYECMECGADCWGPMRFKVDKWTPICPVCETADEMFMRETGQTERRRMTEQAAHVLNALSDCVFCLKRYNELASLAEAAMKIEDIAEAKKCEAAEGFGDFDTADKVCGSCCAAFLFVTGEKKQAKEKLERLTEQLIEVAEIDYDYNTESTGDCKAAMKDAAEKFGFGFEG